MKKVIGACILFFAIISCKTPAKTTTPIPSNRDTIAAFLHTMDDSVSYAIGISVANTYKQQGATTINTSLVSKAIDDILSGKKAMLDDDAVTTVLNNYLTRLQAEKIKPAIEAGEKFLTENKLRPSVRTTSSGLQYQIIEEGGGPSPTLSDTVTCHYKGTLLDNKVFDNSYERGQPITFPLGSVIQGWIEGIQLMTVGSKYKFYIPYTLGYGAFDYGAIPGGSVLIFEVKLLAIKKKQ